MSTEDCYHALTVVYREYAQTYVFHGSIRRSWGFASNKSNHRWILQVKNSLSIRHLSNKAKFVLEASEGVPS
jgi:hypothetical protein